MTPQAVRLAFAGAAFLNPELSRLRDWVRDLDEPGFLEDLGTDPLSLETDYNRLFLSPEGAVCPPWQGAHTADERLMGDSHLSALDWYRRFGIEPAANNEPADHIGLLLLFYSRLIDSGADDAERQVFRLQHLDWIPPFCAKVEQEARHPFWRRLARLTPEWIHG
jgi:TorA maturation chaperone TorD